jgi:hypothetical protein
MLCTLSARAALPNRQAAHIAVAEVFKKLRALLRTVFCFLLWGAIALSAIIASACFIVSQLTIALTMFCIKPPQQAQPPIALLPPSRQKYSKCDLAEIEDPPCIKTSMSQEQVLQALKQQLYGRQIGQQHILNELKLPVSWQRSLSEPITLCKTQTKTLPLTLPACTINPSTKPPFNQLALSLVCWEAMNQVALALNPIKASELKEVASSLKIKNYRRMNKSELLVAIAFTTSNSTPARW